MFAILAMLAFVIGFVLILVGASLNWLLLFLGLALLSIHFIYPWEPWGKKSLGH